MSPVSLVCKGSKGSHCEVLTSSSLPYYQLPDSFLRFP